VFRHQSNNVTTPPFYYKIHSPVVMLEFDHHSGVFLTNDEPRKCHVHTIARTPNGNDYGRELLRLYLATQDPPIVPGDLKVDVSEVQAIKDKWHL